MKQSLVVVASCLLWISIESVQAVELEPKAKVIAAFLGTTKAFKFAGVKAPAELFYSKGKTGKANAVTFIEHGVYEPNCTHTWAVGINPASGAVTQVHLIEASCPHAFPTKTASFLDQYVGKGPADVAKLDGSVTTVAKATGSSKLCTEAVKRAIQDYSKIKGKI